MLFNAGGVFFKDTTRREMCTRPNYKEKKENAESEFKYATDSYGNIGE